MKKKIAKFLSMILVFVMMSGTLPAGQAVFAAEEETATETEVKNDEKTGEKEEDDVKETDSKASKPKIVTSKEAQKETEPTEKQEAQESEKEPESTEKQEPEATESNEPKETEEAEAVESEKQKPDTHSVTPKNAVSNISTVSVTLDNPVAGKPGDFTAEFPSGATYKSSNYDPTNMGYYKNGIAWKNVNVAGSFINPSSGVFQEGHQYQVIIYLSPMSGYQFTTSTTAKVNDNTADIDLSDGYLIIKYTFPKCHKYIKDVSISMSAPVPGEKPDYAPVLPSGVYYHVNKFYTGKNYTKGVMWYDITTSSVLDPDSAVFITGHRYKVSIALESSYGEDNYYFSPSVTAQVNEDSAQTENSNDYERRIVLVSYTFPFKLSLADITLDAPKVGSKPDYSAEFPSGAKYYTQNNNANYYRNDISWFDVTTTSFLDPSSAEFTPGHVYQVIVNLTAEDGFYFDSSTTATVNDENAEASISGKKLCVSYTFPKLPNTYTFTIETSAFYYDLDDNLKTDLSGSCGTITLSKTTAQKGEEVTITATPKDGYTLKKVVLKTSSNGEEDITSEMKFTVGTVQPTVCVYFQELPPVISVNANVNCYDEATGADIVDGSVYVLQNGSAEYAAGNAGISISVNSNEEFTLTAGVKNGKYTFVGWYAGKIGKVGVNLISNNATITCKISAETTYYAAFTTPKTEISSLTFTSDKLPVAGKTIEDCKPNMSVAESGVSVSASWVDMYGNGLPAGYVFTEGEQVQLCVDYTVNLAYQLASDIVEHATLNGEKPTSHDTVHTKLYVVYTVVKDAVVGETFEVGDYNYTVTNANTDGTGTVTLTGVVNNTSSVSIPSTVEINLNTYKVTRIGTKAFYGNKTITSLSIGANIAIIDASAFCGCSNLTTVSGGKGLKTIGASAFALCSKLKSFSIASSVLSKIGAYAFNKDKKLKTLYIKYTTALTKAGVKKSLKGSKVKTVKVKKSKVKKYKKYFKKKNSGRSVKVKK